jgi:hypothetical protein
VGSNCLLAALTGVAAVRKWAGQGLCLYLGFLVLLSLVEYSAGEEECRYLLPSSANTTERSEEARSSIRQNQVGTTLEGTSVD